MKRVIVLTASFGEGHNAAARGVRAALLQLGLHQEEVQVLDLFAQVHTVWNEHSRRGYLALINHAPLLWKGLYHLLDKTPLLEGTLFAFAKVESALARLIEAERPEALVLTYPVYGFLLDRIYPKGQARPFKQFTIVTDSITVNSVWHRCGTDHFIVPNGATADVLAGAGVQPRDVLVLGFPVDPGFALADHVRPAPSAAAGRKVLFMINFAKREAPDLLRELLRLEDVQLTVTVGRDRLLMQSLKAVADQAGRQVEFHGWTDQIPRLLKEHHLLISKAGGATVQEAIAACTPMIISQVVPGQEEGNARLITEGGCGVLAQSPLRIVEAVRQAFADDSAVWRDYHRNVSLLSRPSAALDIGSFILAQSSRH